MDGMTATVFAPLRLELAADGASLAAIVTAAEIPAELHDRVVLILNGQVARDWHHTFTRSGDCLTIGVVPAGGDRGKQTFAAIATLAIVLASGGIAAGLLPAAWSAAGATALQAAAVKGLAFGISMIGALAISALIPPPSVATTPIGRSSAAASPDESPTYRATGQGNAARLWSTVKRVYGRYRIFPDLAAVPLIDNIGKRGTISGLYYFSAGDCTIEDIRFGDQPAAIFNPAMRILRNVQDPPLSYVHRSVDYDELAYTLDETDWLRLQTPLDTVKATIDITFPRGLVRMDGATRRNMTVPFQARWRLKGASTWNYLGAGNFVGAPASSTGGLTYVSEYEPDIDGGGIDSDDVTAWVVQEYRGKNRNDTSVMIFRDGVKLFDRGGYEPGNTPSSVTAGGVTYARGQTPGDTTQSSDTKTQVYSELLIGRPIADNAVRVTNNTREPFTVGASISFPGPGIYEFEIRRTAVPSTSEVIADEAVITLLRSYLSGPVLNMAHRASMAEIQVLATDQLAGNIPPVNAIVTSRLRTFTAAGFTGDKRESANPAAIAIDLLTGGGDGKQTKFPLRPSQIEWADFVRLRDICNEQRTQSVNGESWTGPRFEWNGVIETNLALGEAVNSVLSIARAQLRFTATGKIGLIIDQQQTTPRALITPANSWDFRGQRPFAQQPHAIRVNFTDETRNWEPSSVVVYNTGYSERTATIFEDLDSWGITSFPEAWRYGRFMLAQAILRSESFSTSQDAENLVVQRGDLVTVQHDVPLHGGMSARVTNVAGDVITIDRQFAAAPSGYVSRSSTGVIRSGDIIAVGGTQEFTVEAGHHIVRGDLITLGAAGTVTQDYLVRSIEPGEDFAARLTLVRYDPAVYSDEDGPLPPWDPGFGDDLISGTNIRVTNLAAVQAWAFLDRRPVKAVELAWKIGGTAATYFSAVIEWKPGTTEWIAIGTVTGGDRAFTHRISWDDRALWATKVSYRVRPFNGLGAEGQAATITVQLTDYTAVPLPPRNAFLDVRGQDLTLTWQPSLSADVVNYLIRYTPSTADDVTWLGATLVASVAWDQDQATFKARTGTYLIRAVNSIGRLSSTVFLRTTIETLPDINVIDTIDEAPLGWPGTVYRFTKGTDLIVTFADVLTLDGTIIPMVLSPISYDVRTLAGGTVNVATDQPIAENYLISEPTWDPETTQDQAVYTNAEIIDLGAIYEHFLQAKHTAFAVRDQDFPALARHLQSMPLGASLELLDDSENVPWQCWAEYRSANTQDPIRDWGPINAHGPLATAGVQFGIWRKFLATKATARYLQFRFVAESETDGIRIVITDGLIEIDMPDRVWRRSNIPIQAGGSTVNFDPAFAAAPILAVTIEGATTATSYKALSTSRTATEIALYNNAGASVAGQIDLAALGYGKEREAPI